VEVRYRWDLVGIVDLADERLLIAIECDGFGTHGTLDAMTADCIRHTNLSAAGWRSLRLTWYQVNFHPDWVLQRVRDTMHWAGAEARSA
jgi:very-short-patch-repair endonuclease